MITFGFQALKHALHPDSVKNFVDLAIGCNMVICCRATPKNKSQIIECIKKNTNSVTLAIGDGANDVAMIQVIEWMKIFQNLIYVLIALANSRPLILALEYMVLKGRKPWPPRTMP